jgi:hypothetical protein
MLRIKCSNPACTAKEKKFLWYEQNYVEKGGGQASPDEEGAVSFWVKCTECKADNIIYLKGVKQEFLLRREII